jgi:hypothetical protein
MSRTPWTPPLSYLVPFGVDGDEEGNDFADVRVLLPPIGLQVVVDLKKKVLIIIIGLCNLGNSRVYEVYKKRHSKLVCVYVGECVFVCA